MVNLFGRLCGAAALLGAAGGALAEHPAAALGYKTVPIRHYRFSTVDRDAQMWSALYVASNGKLYVGLCTHADSANVYEFDPATEKIVGDQAARLARPTYRDPWKFPAEYLT